MQVRSCVEGTVGALSQCKKPDEKTSEEVSGVITALAKWDLINNFDVKGQACSCGTDFCVPDCDAGLQISGLW